MTRLIAIAGSQGAGKTVLLNALSTYLPNVELVQRKTSRSILADWNVTLEQVNTDSELTTKFQDEILKRKYEDESSALKFNCINPLISSATDNKNPLPEYTQQTVLTERTMIDLLVYATVVLGHQNKYSDWLSAYGRSCINITNTLYDHVFYITGGHFHVENDGVRGINDFYSELVDAAMLSFYKKHVNYFQLTIINVADLDQRVKIVKETIDTILR